MIHISVNNEDSKKLINLFGTKAYHNEQGLLVIDCLEEENDIVLRQIDATINEEANTNKRKEIISILKISSFGTQIEQYVLSLVKHYKEEIDLYITDDSEDFKSAIENESSEPYLTYLNIVIAEPSEDFPEGKTVKDSILERIT